MGEGRIWYVIRQGKKTRTIPADVKSTDRQILYLAKDKITFDLKSISCVIEELCADRPTVTLDDVVDRCASVLHGENPYAERINAYGKHFPIRNDIARISKAYADTFEVIGPAIPQGVQTSLLTYIDTLILTYKQTGRSSSNSYRSTRHSLSRFLNGKDYPLALIDDRFIQNYNNYLQSQVSTDTTSFYMRVLRTVLNHARQDGLIQANYTWPSHINIPCNTSRKNPQHKSLSPEVIRHIAALELSNDAILSLVRDLFMFSFYAQGLELIDLANLLITDLSADMLTYRRRSKGRTTSVRLGENALAIISRHHEAGSDYLFPLLMRKGRKYSFSHARTEVGSAMKAIGERLSPSINLTFGMSRYSWLAISAENNMSESLI